MTHIAAALSDLLNERDTPVREALDRHFSDTYRQRTDGVWSSRSEFAQHIEHLRKIIDHIDIRVLDEVTDGAAYADRHEARVTMRSGDVVVQEVYLFGTLANDGRFAEVHEVTHMLHGREAYRAIGTASS